MFEAQSINADHKDLIHDVAYDFYGERIATCSSDQYVKIWDLDSKGQWQKTASWKAHSGSVWKVTWAHPEYGQVIATCSFDRTATVWEEGDSTVPGEGGLRQWIRRTNLIDSRTSVTDIKFGPKNLGLLIVTCSADGIIRIYEAPDVMNLAQWTLQHEIPTKLPVSCLSWNQSLSRINPPMIAVGSEESGVFLLEYSEAARRWTRADCLPPLHEPVHDVAFAPNLGRSYHLLAIATKDVRIISIKPMADTANVQNGGMTRYECDVVATMEDHLASVWRVSWNVTGTILGSSGDDGYVRLWKMQYLKEWKCVATLKGDGSGGRSEAGPAGVAASAGPARAVAATTHYIKLGTITNPNQVPWH